MADDQHFRSALVDEAAQLTLVRFCPNHNDVVAGRLGADKALKIFKSLYLMPFFNIIKKSCIPRCDRRSQQSLFSTGTSIFMPLRTRMSGPVLQKLLL